MALARATLLTFLAGQLHDLARVAALPETDSAEGYGFVITQTLQTVGLATDADAIPVRQLDAAYLLADYYGLRKLQRIFASQKDTSIRQVGDEVLTTDQRSRYFDQVTKMLEQARKEAEATGYLVAGAALPALGSSSPIRGDQPCVSEYRRAGCGCIDG